MDKRIINAVAGSGKTTSIVNECEKRVSESRILILTYTTTNQETLRNAILEKFDEIPENIYIFGYFKFIYRVCYLPFANRRNKGICYDTPHYTSRSDYTTDGRIYSNRIAKRIMQK